MEPCTVLDWFDPLWIDFHWLALDIYPLDGAFFCCKFMHEEGCSDIFCIWKLGGEKNIKKTQIRWLYCHENYLFSPRWSLSLLLWHSPHFPFVASLKSAPCSEPQAATREMVNELQTLFWQYFFSFFFLKDISFVLTYIAFFLQSTFLPGPLAASEAAVGTTGQPGESLRSLTRPDCWLRHTTERFRYAIWQRVTATSCLIYTVQHYCSHDYNVDSHPFEQFRHSRLWLHPLNVT